MLLRSSILVSLALLSTSTLTGQDELAIWKEFLTALKTGTLTQANIRPYEQLGDEYRTILLGYLDSLRDQATPGDWLTTPEVIRADSRIQFITPWSAHGQRVTYCFSFLTEGTRWYFQHLEAIFIRLDTIAHFPTSDFPDISVQQKDWAREEIYWSFVILNVYLPTVETRGKNAALTMLKDGSGYFMSAKAWVPFVSPERAFILYLCWEQAQLRGSDVMLMKLEEHEAIVKLRTHYFTIYSVAAHLRPKISSEDYREVFETIWQDRALRAGWRLDIEYLTDHTVVFRFSRQG